VTEQPPPANLPPPPPGGYPPPPPPSGGGFAPQGAVGYPAPSAPALPKSAYASWSSRVLAWIIDIIPLLILEGIGVGVLLSTRETACVTDTSEYDLGEFCATGATSTGQIAIIVTGLLALAYWIWNLGYRQGTTGASIGKGVMKFRIVNENTGLPVGFGMSVVREIIYWVVAGLCAGIIWLVAVLFPLWDDKRQTLVDKVLNHVALPNRAEGEIR